MPMAYTTHTLPNGLRILHCPSPTDVAYCGFFIDAGTRDEMPEESGMAHFVEHLLFKGTQHRKAWHILNRMEVVGGDLNAYTTKEETAVYAAFLSEHFDRAAELLTDIVFHSTFPQHEIDREVEVIIDEIQSYEDSPGELIYDDFEDLIFHGHPLGRNILGDPRRLHEYRSEDALAFTRRYYQPANMVCFVRGNIPFDKIVRRMEKLTSDLQVPDGWTRPLRQAPQPYSPQQRTDNRETHQAHVILGCRGYSSESGLRTGFYLLNNLLGGPGMNSLLNVSLRERHGLVYTVESNLVNYTDTGTFSIYFGCDPHDIGHCLSLIHKELQRLADHPLTEKEFRAVQKQIKGQIGVACDNFENNILDAAKAYLHYHQTEEVTQLFERIDNLTPQLLQEIAADKFAEQQLSLLIYR